MTRHGPPSWEGRAALPQSFAGMTEVMTRDRQRQARRARSAVGGTGGVTDALGHQENEARPTGATVADVQDYVRSRIVVDEQTGCWLWRGPYGHGGYGSGSDPRTRRARQAHRMSHEVFNGPIPDGMYVCHTCDCPPCVNPEHLWTGTPKENVRDMMAKGRHVPGQRKVRS